MRGFIRSQDGTSVVECAILAPVFVFLLIGLIEIGRYAFFAILAAHAAHAGVQYGAQDNRTAADNSGMIYAAREDAPVVSSWRVNATHLCSTGGSALGSCGASASLPTDTIYYVKVRVSGTFAPLLDYPGIPNNVGISGSAVMRVASQ
jgi:hypothetical protein